MQLCHLLTLSSFTRLKASSLVFPDFFYLPVCILLVFPLIYYGIFCLHVAAICFCVAVFCPQLGSYLFLLKSLCLFYDLSKCVLLFFSYI